MHLEGSQRIKPVTAWQGDEFAVETATLASVEGLDHFCPTVTWQEARYIDRVRVVEGKDLPAGATKYDVIIARLFD